MSVEIIKSKIRDVVDFPQKGIVFRDLTTVFKDADCLRELSDMLTAIYAEKGITKVVGIESRGFIMGPILATRIGAGFVPMRKPGKLPAETWQESYTKEYGVDVIEMPFVKMMLFYCTMICWRQVGLCWPLIIW